MSSQPSLLPVDVRPEEVMRERTLGGAIELCAKVAGFDFDKQLQCALGVDKAQFSRWQSGQEGVVWPKLAKLMDHCGNDAPVLWMAHQRGFDVARMPRREDEVQKENRLLREENAALRRALQRTP